jgi:hypothetical protein
MAAAAKSEDEMTLEEEVDMLVREEIARSDRMSKFKNEKGVEYAPWMKVSDEDAAKMRGIMRERAEARRKQREQETSVRGSLLRDSAFQELSGTGVRGKVVNGDSVELEWATDKETNTKGFIVKRRPAKTQDFTTIASYKNYGPLAGKGAAGGVYRYLDENVGAGGWVYRVTECEVNGSENDLSQCLVEVQTKEEQTGQLLAVAALGVIAAGVVAAGVLLDPIQ